MNKLHLTALGALLCVYMLLPAPVHAFSAKAAFHKGVAVSKASFGVAVHVAKVPVNFVLETTQSALVDLYGLVTEAKSFVE